MIEIWQGRRSRLRDRFAYLWASDDPASPAADPAVPTDTAPGWRIERLAP